MIDTNTLANKIFSLLKGNGLNIKIFDATGTEITDPEQGRRFFVLSPNIMVTINEDENTLEFNKGVRVDDSVDNLQKGIRKLADEFLMNSDIKVFGKQIQPRHFSYEAKNKKDDTIMNENVNSLLIGKVLKELDYAAGMTAEALAANIPGSDLNQIQQALNKLVHDGKIEPIHQNNGMIAYGKKMEEAVYESFSKMFGSLKTSQQTLENVRILVKHKVPVDESVRGARSRQIQAIFLECNGERFRFPHNYLAGARAMAQHLAHGGTMGDKVGSYIVENTGNLLKLQSFNRYVTANKLINEDSSGIVETIKENIETIRTELRKLTGTKTYESVKARIETFEREQLAEDDVGQLKDLFTIRRFDEKFEEVLPIVKQLIQEKDTYHKRIEEAAAAEIRLRPEKMEIPIFEFSSDNARLGFKVSELALRIMENEELSAFVGNVGTKISRDGQINDFEKAILEQVLQNSKIAEEKIVQKEIKESVNFENYIAKYTMNFY